MAFVSKSNMAGASTKMVSAGSYVGAFVGGVAGFMAADVIGFSGLIDTLWNTTGIETVVPALNNIQPVVVPLIAAGIYVAIGLAIGRISFDGKAVNIVVKFVSWFFVGAGLREGLVGLVGGVRAIKTAGTVTA